MSKVILLIFALQFLLSRHQISANPLRTASFVVDDDSDESDDEELSEENSDSDNEDETESDEDDEAEPSHFNCILLGDQGCNATCSSIASLYSTSSKGTCDKSHICQCTLPNKTLISSWNEKFRQDDVSKSLLKMINKDSEVRDEVHEILLEFPRTPADTIQHLKDQYPDMKKYNKLKPNEKLEMPVSEYIDKRGRLDQKKLRKNISAQIQKSLKKGDFSIDEIDYKSNVESFLEEDDPILPSVVNDKNFVKFISKFFPKDSIEESTEPDLPVFDQVPDLVESMVIQQFVKYLEDKKKSEKKEKQKSQKKDEKKTNDKKPRKNTKQ